MATLTLEQERWAAKRRQGISPSRLKSKLIEQDGLCALACVPMLFDVREGTPEKDGQGCHPLYPAVDHIDPGNRDGGFQIVCYALNDLKGHLPLDCFNALIATDAWRRLMQAWKQQVERDPHDRAALMRLLRPNASRR